MCGTKNSKNCKTRKKEDLAMIFFLPLCKKGPPIKPIYSMVLFETRLLTCLEILCPSGFRESVAVGCSLCYNWKSYI